MKIMNKYLEYNNKEGLVLLYALLVISLITAIAITVSIIVIKEIKLTGGSTDATLAYYAAESGIEKGLYIVKVYRSDGTKTLNDAVNDIKAIVDVSFDSNKAEYTDEQTADKTSKIGNEEIKENNYIQADYYYAGDPLNPPDDPNDPTEKLIVESIEVQNTGNNPFSWAEVSWIAWDATGALGTSDSARKVIGPTDLQNGWTINNLDVFDSFDPVGYRIRIKALFGDLSNVIVTPYDEPDGPNGTGDIVENLPSQIVIKSVGTKSKFKQALTALVPWQVPLFGLYDYVLYSEGDILKTIILSQAVYSSGVIQIEADNETLSCINCVAAGTCADYDWLAESCSGTNVSCTIMSGSAASFCSLPGTVGVDEFFTLPIPESIPASQEYYVSLRYRPEANSAGTLEILVDDPQEGEVGLTFDYSDDATPEWDTCTLAEPFALGTELDRNITYTNQDNNNYIDLDWYQISTHKIFKDCPQLGCVPACSIDTECPDDWPSCQVGQCINPGTCSASCSLQPVTCDNNNDGYCPPNNCCPADPDCAGPPEPAPDPEYLRYLAVDEDGVDLTGLFYSGQSMRPTAAGHGQGSGITVNDLKNVWAADENNVWVVGNSGDIFYSGDGGLNWIRQAAGITSENLYGIWGTGTDNIWVVGGNWTAGNTSVVLHCSSNCTNGNWGVIDVGVSGKPFRDVHGWAANDFWIVGRDGVAVHYDGSWSDYSGFASNHLFGVWVDSATGNAWAVGGSTSFSSPTSEIYFYDGSSWSQDLLLSSSSTLKAVSGVNANTIWAVGSTTAGGNIIVFYDGIDWTTQSPPSTLLLQDVSAYTEAGSSRAIAVGSGGSMIYYDGSLPWTETITDTSDMLLGIFAYDPNHIWVVGEAGLIRFVNPQAADKVDVVHPFDQYWFTRELANVVIPEGNYYVNIYLPQNPMGGPDWIDFHLEAGYCISGCLNDSDFVTKTSTSVPIRYDKDTPTLVFNQHLLNNAWSGPQTCALGDPCRLWFRLYTVDENSSAWFPIKVGGTENENSYLDLP